MSIKIQDLQFSRNGRHILQDISAVFQIGKLHFCIGKNGSGKSSLLSCLMGLAKEGAQIEIMGKPLFSLSAKERAKMMAVVAQHHETHFAIPVWDYILMGRFPYLNWLGSFGDTDKAIVAKYVDLLGIKNLISQNIQTLSGGEFQKVCIARALAQETPILLLDEPAQSLDPYNKKWLYDFLPTLVEKGKTVICITHDIEYLSQPAEVWGLAEGRMVWHGNVGEKKEEMWEAVFGRIVFDEN